MNAVAQEAPQGVSVAFKTTKFQDPAADFDRRIVVKGLDFNRDMDFIKELSVLVPTFSVSVRWDDGVMVNLSTDSHMTKYEFMEQVLVALQKVGVNISD
ncbi:MAG: hypothetical protein Q7S52_05630 [bacterium]|nr:hypothetical protein [bacterium]